MSAPATGNPKRPSRSALQWVVGAGLLAAAVVYAAVEYGPSIAFEGRGAVPPRVIRVPASLRPSDVVPASPGDLAGCNLLLVTFDTTRADRVGCYGNDGIETPSLDSLAAEGVLFSQAIAPAPVTLPSHASILTGLYPFRHGARTNTLSRLGDAHETLAEVLSRNGYATAAVVSAFVLDSRFGTDQGFAVYDDKMGEGDDQHAERSADRTTGRAEAWLRAHAGGRFFLWVHYYDPHFPREAPAEFLARCELPYDAEISFADSALGSLLAVVRELGLADRTLVVATADHGEGLGQHGEPTHSYLVYDSTMRVPLLMRCGARLGGGVHVARPVSLVDVMPTALSLLGVAAPAGLDGIDLTRPPGSGARPIYVEAMEALADYGWAALLGVYEGSLKYIHGPDSELYDLSVDPFEEKNLIGSRPKLAEAARLRLIELYGEDLELAASDRFSRPDTETLERLRSLGYISAGATDLLPLSDRPHPRDMIPLVERAFAAMAMEKEKGIDEVIARLERLVAEHPDFVAGHQYLGDACARAGKPDRAMAAFERCLELRPGQPIVLLAAARVQRSQRRFDEAAALFREALGRVPDDFGALLDLGRMQLRRGETDEAVELLSAALEVRPRDEVVPELLSAGMLNLGRRDDAIELYRRHLAAEPGLPAVRSALGQLLSSAERCGEAVGVLKEGIALAPDDLELANSLAWTLATCPDRAVVDLPQAAALMERVCTETGYSDAKFVYTLSMVRAASGRLDEAIELAERAQRLIATSRTARDRGLAGPVRQSLEQYRAIKLRLSAPAASGESGTP